MLLFELQRAASVHTRAHCYWAPAAAVAGCCCVCRCCLESLRPFIGALIHVTRHFHRYHDMIKDVATEVGDGASWSSGILGNPPFVYIGADPSLVEHVLKTNFWKYEKGEFFKSTMEVLLGHGIFNSDGSVWQRQRKIASHMFTARNLKEDMSAVFLKNAELMCKRIRRHAQQSRQFDIQDLFFSFTLDSFAEIAFGESCGCLSDGAPVPFAKAFDLVQAHSAARFFAPGWQVKRWLNIGSERVIARNMQLIRDFGFGVIDRTRRARMQDKSHKPDLLSRFIEYAETNQESVSDAELLDVVLNFIIAGRDTTACLLSWAAYELTQHPALQEKLYAECVGFSTAQNSSHAVADLPLLHAFILETLRLHPPVPQDTKECIEDDVWPSGQRIPKGTMVAWCPYLMGRSAKLWGPNPERFSLEKWFDADGKPIKEPSPYHFPVFNAGLRLCLGKSVAILESTMLLSTIIQQFKFSREDTSPVTYALTVTLPIKGGLKVKATERM